MNAFYRKGGSQAAASSLEKALTRPRLCSHVGVTLGCLPSEEPPSHGGCEANRCINNLVLVVLLILYSFRLDLMNPSDQCS